jgi:hypothetical protein
MMQNPRRTELSTVPFLNNALDLLLAAWNTVFGLEHDETGRHTTITATGTISEQGRTLPIGAAEAYTPTWTASSVNPDLGDGTLTGRSMRVGPMRFVEIALSYGSTSTAGTGAWAFSLPSTAVSTSFSCMTAEVVATVHRIGVARLGTTTTINVFTEGAGGVGAGVPVVWAAGYQVIVSGWYLEA